MRYILLLAVLTTSNAFAIPCSVEKTWNVEVAKGQGMGGSNVSQTSVTLDTFNIEEADPQKNFEFEKMKGSVMVGAYDVFYLEWSDGASKSFVEADTEKGAALSVSHGNEGELGYVSFMISCAPRRAFQL